MDSIPQGPQDFESLLTAAVLSEREKQAVRSVALSLTAERASKLMGVSPSTVGSYRQRAYAKMGVATKTEFLDLPEVACWRRQQAKAHVAPAPTEPVALDGTSENDGFPNPPTQAASFAKLNSDKSQTASTAQDKVRIAVCTACIAVILAALFVFVINLSPRYQPSPNGSLASQYGDVPNVVGMRVDDAASVIASAGFCPEFQAAPGNVTPGTVTSINDIGSTEDLGDEISQFTWQGGTTAGYNERGNWKGYVTLVVAV